MTERSKPKPRVLNIVACLFIVWVPTLLGACARSDAAAAEDAAEAQALLEQRRFGEARLLIKEAIAARDDEPQFHILRGRIEMAGGSPSNAFDAYSDAMSLDPANMEALQAVSQLGLQTGHFRESLEATDAILSLSPDEPGALLVRGLHAVIRKRFVEADGYADRILARNPSDEGGVILKARIAVRKGSPQNALRVLASHGAGKPSSFGIVMTRLEVYRVLRDAPGMRSQFKLLGAMARDDVDLRLDEANFAFKDGRPREGSALIITILADPKVRGDLATSTVALWQEYEADGPGDASLAPIAANGSTDSRLAAAEFLAERTRLEAARRMVMEVDPEERTAVEALVAAREERWADAMRLADRVVAKDKTHCLALTVRAEIFLQRANLAAALRSAQQAANQCPSQVRAWSLAALAQSRRQDPENARRIWRQGISANPQNTQMARAYVEWLLRNSQDREALAVARRLTHAAPALLSGWRLYGDVCRQLAQDCARDAEAGLRNASTLYAIDLLPGQAPPNGLFGRFAPR